MSNVTYIDCNRSGASIKSEINKNEWTNTLQEPLKLFSGSEVTIQNSFINYKGLSGGSVELLEDYNISMSYGVYLSHTDIQAIKSISNSTVYTSVDTFHNKSGLHSIYYKYYDEVNYDKLMSVDLYNKLNTSIDVNESPVDSFTLYSEIEEGLIHGYTEQPLCAVFVNAGGYLEPLIQEAEITVNKGIYGISQLSDLITNQLNGVKRPFRSGEFNENEIDYFNEEFNSTLKGQLSVPANPWDYEYDLNSASRVTLQEILTHATTPFMNAQTQQEKRYLFITCSKFKELVDLWKVGQKTNATFQWQTFKNDNYIMVIKNTVNQPSTPPRGPALNNRWYNPVTNTIATATIPARPQAQWDYNPYINGYYLGTSSFLLNYDTTKSGFSMQYLHEPRRQPTNDNLGAKNTQEGEVVSFVKSWNASDLLNAVGCSVEEERKVKNSLLNPRQRHGGVFIINWDQNKALSTSSKTTITDPNQILYNWVDYFNGDENKAKNKWLETLWAKLGFTYDQLANTNSFENVCSYDLPISKLVGKTTNNSIDISLNNSISGQYCPLQGSSATDYVNPNLPYVIENEVQQYGFDAPARSFFQINEYNYQTRKNVYYMSMNLYPVLTQSSEIIAKYLPDLSEEGYFIISSDITNNSKDTLGKGDPLTLLGVVAKSSLSNQDFISSFQTITQTLTQDKVLNNIKIRILNPDLSNPDLNSRSSVILKIINNIPKNKN